MLQAVFILLAVILVLVGLATLSSVFSQNLAYKRAEKAAREFCRDNKLQFMELYVLQNHYVLHYQKEDGLYYSKFHFESDGAIIWIKSVA